MYLLPLRRLVLDVQSVWAALLQEQYLRPALRGRKPVLLVADESAEGEALDVAEAVAALFVHEREVARVALLLLVVPEHGEKVLVDERLVLRLHLLEASVLPDEDELVERRALEELRMPLPT